MLSTTTQGDQAMPARPRIRTLREKVEHHSRGERSVQAAIAAPFACGAQWPEMALR
jgi:hypothetical protein